MFSTVDYLDLAKKTQKYEKDAELARALGVSRPCISEHRKRRYGMTNETAVKVAALAKIDPVQVLIAVNIERAKSVEEREAWKRLAIWAHLHRNEIARGMGEEQRLTEKAGIEGGN